jgi:hypothetical protein
MVPDFVVNSADGADAPITLSVITSPITGRQLAANAGRILAGAPIVLHNHGVNSPQSRGGYSLRPGPILPSVSGRMPATIWPDFAAGNGADSAAVPNSPR